MPLITCWKSAQERGFWEDGSGSPAVFNLIKPPCKRTEHVDNKTNKPVAAFKTKWIIIPMSPKINGVETNHHQAYNYMIPASPLQREEKESNRAVS